MGRGRDLAVAGRRRVGLSDVAKLAGVSLATVDRVLNERGETSSDTARRVIEAARTLGLKRLLPAPYPTGLRIEVLLTRPDSSFLARINQAFARAAATLDRSVIVERTFLDETMPKQVADRILASRAQALVVYCQEDPEILAAIETVVAAKKLVVTIISDLPTAPRLTFVGVDQTGAGRAAAYFIARMAPLSGKVLALTHRLRYRAHANRISGFHAGLAAYAPHLTIAAVLEGRDDSVLARRLVADALAAHDDVGAIYNSGGANDGVVEAIAQFPFRTITFVGHELNQETAALLRSGAMSLVIDQNPEQHAQQAIELVLQAFSKRTGTPASGLVPFTIHGPENLSPF